MSTGPDDGVDEDCDSEDSVLCPAPATATATATTTASAVNDPTIHATVSFSPVSLPLPLPLPPPRAAPSPVPPPEWPNTAWYPRIAVAAENDFISKYLEVNFSVVTIFNATRDNRISQFCAHGEECHIPNSALTFICPPPDCGAMAGIPGTEYYMLFTRAELVWKPNVTVEPTEVYSTRFFYAITTTECVYPSDFRQYCEPKPIQLLEWISITDVNIVPILDNFLMPSHVEDSNRVWPEFLQIAALGLLKATAIITWLNNKLWQNRGDWKPQEFVTNWARTWSGDVSSSLKKFV
ncbi:hypothetical protein Pelo_18502 [Pelomyxa schiedti]|nr:hypothetical protein Pelo_18502 [Pelomyxa schiedti]